MPVKNNGEPKSEVVRFRVTKEFHDNLMTLKESTPGCKEMEFQHFIVRLIELGLEVEKGAGPLKKEVDIRCKNELLLV